MRYMALREPASMDECVYFTNRNVGKLKIRSWVFRENCTNYGIPTLDFQFP